jgi:hypothetical protein
VKLGQLLSARSDVVSPRLQHELAMLGDHATTIALPHAYFARRRAAHLRRVQEAWPDGLRDVVPSITAGRSLAQALGGLAATGRAPLQEAFARFPMPSRMLGTVPALEVIKEELPDPSSFNSHTHALLRLDAPEVR